MPLTINTNVSSLIAQRNLDKATNALNTSIERMTTGYKINHAADNAAGYSIADQWVTKLGSIDVATNNAATGADLLTTAEESYQLLTSHLQRIRDLTTQASNGTYATASLSAIQAEITARLQEIVRIAANCEFNGIKLMSDATNGGVGTNGINLQVGLYNDNASIINLEQNLFSDASVYGLFANLTGATGTTSFANLMTAAGLTDLTKLKSTTLTERNTALNQFAAACIGMKYNNGKIVKQDGTTPKEPKEMLQYLDLAIDNISTRATRLGAAQNRISSAISALDVQSQNLTSSLSTLRDTDIAKESSSYLQAQILQQASATLLSTANQLPSVALNLI